MSDSRAGHRRGVSCGKGLVLSLGSLTHVGVQRSSNQDAYCALVGPDAPQGVDALLAVADGMGGHKAGEVASAMAIEGLVGLLSHQSSGTIKPVRPGEYDSKLEEIVQQVNGNIHREAARPETQGMGTTLTVAVLACHGILIAHVGDSRAYLLRKGKLRQLTQDHSWVGQEVARGTMTAEEARVHPRRNIITRCLGTAPEVQVDRMAPEMEEGDILLLCSDGLYSLVTDDEIGRILGEEAPQQACDSLVERANALGGHDNVTVVVARVDHLKKDKASATTHTDIHQRTTVELRPRSQIRRNLAITLLRGVSPLWLPGWAIIRLGRALWRLGS